MTASGALVVVVSVTAGLAIAMANGLDGSQAAMVCAFCWIVASAIYHAGRSVLWFLRPRRRVRR